uniref:Failed axon connections n=1 Tax=Timema tahoe TaxID=61484 RepID=A0A7R9FIP7_9NEOP|nr:unnamed protein product [Timema tahoe]
MSVVTDVVTRILDAQLHLLHHTPPFLITLLGCLVGEARGTKIFRSPRVNPVDREPDALNRAAPMRVQERTNQTVSPSSVYDAVGQFHRRMAAPVVVCSSVLDQYSLRGCSTLPSPRHDSWNVDHKMKFRSKKGQLPFVELNGEEIADSAIILKELGQRYEKDLDAGLTNDQKNMAHAMISMIENHLIWVVTWWRSKYPENVLKGYKVNLQHALGTKIPNGILNFFFKFTFGRKVSAYLRAVISIILLKGAKKVKAQGIGVHKPEEIMEFGQNDLKVLSDMLADKPFFFGDEPTTLDVVAFASLAQIYFIEKEVQYTLRDYMQENCANLVGHVNRMKERCFPDWEDICKTLDLNSHLPKPPPEEKETKGKEEEKKQEKEGDKDIDKEIEKDIEKEKSEKDEKDEKGVEENKQKEEKEATK